MEYRESDQVSRARRDFLLAAGNVGAIGAVAFLLGRHATVVAAEPLPAETPAGGGYRETEHIRKYYDTAAYW